MFRIACLTASLLVLLTFSAKSQSSADCLLCHSNHGLTMTRAGATVPLFVDGVRYKSSVHASLSCVDCHTGFSAGDLPHAKVIKPVQCRVCHEIAGFDNSIHGLALGAGGNGSSSCIACHGSHEIRSAKQPEAPGLKMDGSGMCTRCHKEAQEKFAASAHGSGKGTPSCADCHGSAHRVTSVQSSESAVSRKNQVKLCLKCHLDNPDVRARVGYSAEFIASYKTSVHGAALTAGNEKAPSCSDCHGAHDPRKGSDSLAQISRWRVAETCAKCHPQVSKDFGESVHGKALKNGNVDVPSCTNCHGEHQIFAASDPRSSAAAVNVSREICSTCHESVQLNAKYGLPSGKVESFADSYHGLASRAGATEVANCASCHGVHNIKPSSDPASTISAGNLAATCRRCHPGANNNFAKGPVHVIAARSGGSAVLYWIRTIYILLIIVIVGLMLLHNFLDFTRRTKHRAQVEHGTIPPQPYRNVQHVRMPLNERIQHGAMFSSFILLVITGFMLKFPDSWWVVPIRRMSGHLFELRSILHRVAGIVMVAVSVYHLLYLLFTRRGRRFGSDMLPKWRDVGDLWQNLRYLLRISKDKPRFDRFGYIEKAEYWALVWGVIVMAATGIVMWFDNYFMGIFTKLGWDISRTIHYYEACLATLAILVWHFYYVIFNPDVYPMNTAWFTGNITEHEMGEEHPLELEKMRIRDTELG